MSHYSGLYLPSRGSEGSMKTWCKCYRLNNGVRLSPIFYIKSCPKVFIFFASAQISLTYLNHIVSKCTIYCVVDFWSLTNEGFWAEGWWGGEGGDLSECQFYCSDCSVLCSPKQAREDIIIEEALLESRQIL